MAQWKAEKILTPAKRGRKPGSGKKNIVKTSSGKIVFVSVDLSRYENGTVLVQVPLHVHCYYGRPNHVCVCVSYRMGFAGHILECPNAWTVDFVKGISQTQSIVAF